MEQVRYFWVLRSEKRRRIMNRSLLCDKSMLTAPGIVYFLSPPGPRLPFAFCVSPLGRFSHWARFASAFIVTVQDECVLGRAFNR
eukprot:scaffold1603_cov45-Attheya_sp.AAC.1